MDQALKTKIVEALRSGKYKQGTGLLYNSDNDCYCVMGVVAKEAGMSFDKYGTDIVAEDGASLGYVPLYELFGEDHVDGESADTKESKVWKLINRNDSRQASFVDLADDFERLA